MEQRGRANLLSEGAKSGVGRLERMKTVVHKSSGIEFLNVFVKINPTDPLRLGEFTHTESSEITRQNRFW